MTSGEGGSQRSGGFLVSGRGGAFVYELNFRMEGYNGF